MARRRTYLPQRTFGDDYEGLVRLLLAKEFSFSHVDINQCQQDTIAQREERAARNAIEVKYRETIARFAVAQSERHGRYMRLLNSARAAYRDDPAMLAALENFARKRSRRGTSAEAPQTDAAPQPEEPRPSQPLLRPATA